MRRNPLTQPVSVLWSTWMSRLRAAPARGEHTRTPAHWDGRERRGVAPKLRKFAQIQDAQAQLAQSIAAAKEGATSKLQNSAHWQAVGYCEALAANEAQQVLDMLPTDCSCVEWVCIAHVRFLELTARWRANAQDTDGYGLGTVHAIRRVLEERT